MFEVLIWSYGYGTLRMDDISMQGTRCTKEIIGVAYKRRSINDIAKISGFKTERMKYGRLMLPRCVNNYETM